MATLARIWLSSRGVRRESARSWAEATGPSEWSGRVERPIHVAPGPRDLAIASVTGDTLPDLLLATDEGLLVLELRTLE